MRLAPGKSTYQIIHELPDSATPWQQDSAVQAYFRPGEDNHYSDRPDTLGLPGQRFERPSGDIGRDSLGYPTTYVDTLQATGIHTGHHGVMADPPAYRVGGDNLISSLLLLGCIIAILAQAASGRFVNRMTKNFFYLENDRTTAVPDTKLELGSQLVLAIFTGFLLALVYFCYAMHEWSPTAFVISHHGMLGVYTAIVLLYLVLKALAYQFVNWVFFDRKKNEQWNRSVLFLTAMEGVVMTPVVLVLVFGHLSLTISLVYVIFVILFAKILTFYKCYLIFFRRFGAFLQIILYFCALELMPLAVMVGLLEIFSSILKINF